MEIKQLDNQEYDVFLGKGWHNWVRVKYTSGGVEVVNGSFQPSQQTLTQIFFKIKKKFILTGKK